MNVDLSSSASLLNVDLSGAKLWRANLSESFLTDVNLSGAKLGGADFSSAFLGNVNLSGAFLMGAENLTQSQLDQTRADPKKPPNLQGLVDAETGKPLVWCGMPLDDEV